VERLAERLGAGKFKQRYAGRYVELRGPAGPLALLIPMTYMNLSGESVGPAAGSLKAAPAQVLIVHDELDLPFGVVRGKLGGGTAGHNGLRSISAGLGSGDYPRIRIGIGRPPAEFRGDQAAWVLTGFSEPADEVDAMLADALAMTEVTIAEGIDAAIARFHAAEPGSRARERRERRDGPEEDAFGEADGPPAPS
jgi:PTH1 family peptidyl-tRNA hydrolase